MHDCIDNIINKKNSEILKWPSLMIMKSDMSIAVDVVYEIRKWNE